MDKFLNFSMKPIGNFPIAYSENIGGGYKIVATTEDFNKLKAKPRILGPVTIVTVLEEKKEYIFKDNKWEVFGGSNSESVIDQIIKYHTTIKDDFFSIEDFDSTKPYASGDFAKFKGEIYFCFSNVNANIIDPTVSKLPMRYFMVYNPVEVAGMLGYLYGDADIRIARNTEDLTKLKGTVNSDEMFKEYARFSEVESGRYMVPDAEGNGFPVVRNDAADNFIIIGDGVKSLIFEKPEIPKIVFLDKDEMSKTFNPSDLSKDTYVGKIGYQYNPIKLSGKLKINSISIYSNNPTISSTRVEIVYINPDNKKMMILAQSKNEKIVKGKNTLKLDAPFYVDTDRSILHIRIVNSNGQNLVGTRDSKDNAVVMFEINYNLIQWIDLSMHEGYEFPGSAGKRDDPSIEGHLTLRSSYSDLTTEKLKPLIDGNVTGDGRFTFPSRAGNVSYGMEEATPEELKRTGVPYKILFEFELSKPGTFGSLDFLTDKFENDFADPSEEELQISIAGIPSDGSEPRLLRDGFKMPKYNKYVYGGYGIQIPLMPYSMPMKKLYVVITRGKINSGATSKITQINFRARGLDIDHV